MKSMKQTPANQMQIARVKAACEAMLDEVLCSGIHGRATIEVTIADGTIQTICRKTERIEK